MSLQQQIEDIRRKTDEIKAANPSLTSLSWEILDTPIEDMRLIEPIYSKIKFREELKRMALIIHPGAGVFISVYSKEVKLKEHLVIEDAYVNV